MKVYRSFGFAMKGLSYAFRTQLNFKIHFGIAAIACLMGFLLKINSSEWLWILAAIGLVLGAELGNTAMEVLVDLVSPEYHPKAGIVKDLAAAAVLIAAFTSLSVGLIIFLPKLLHAA